MISYTKFNPKHFEERAWKIYTPTCAVSIQPESNPYNGFLAISSPPPFSALHVCTHSTFVGAACTQGVGICGNEADSTGATNDNTLARLVSMVSLSVSCPCSEHEWMKNCTIAMISKCNKTWRLDVYALFECAVAEVWIWRKQTPQQRNVYIRCARKKKKREAKSRSRKRKKQNKHERNKYIII